MNNRPAPAPAPAIDILLGVLFGIVLTKAEVISWFRIQEMFRFEAFHMFGIIGSAIAVAAVSRRRLPPPPAPTLCGEPTPTADASADDQNRRGTRFWLGGAIFGLGWALTGACPGPLFILIGGGLSVMIVALGSALAGTWAYGYLRSRLPH